MWTHQLDVVWKELIAEEFFLESTAVQPHC